MSVQNAITALMNAVACIARPVQKAWLRTQHQHAEQRLDALQAQLKALRGDEQRAIVAVVASRNRLQAFQAKHQR